jgi:cell division protein FtsI (penicillin-binding protein 3)
MAQITAPQRAAVPRWRINILLLIIMLASLLVSRQLVTIQVFGENRGRQLDQLAQVELNQQVVLQPRRGTIYDRNGVALALNVDKPSLYVDPTRINDPQQLVHSLHSILGIDATNLIKIFENKQQSWIRIKRWLEQNEAEQVVALGERGQPPAGLYLVPEAKREYPHGEFAANIVGVANHEGEGIAGVEAFYNGEIKGITGTLRAEQTAGGHPIALAPQQLIEPQDGSDITLTIDSSIQKLLEDELGRVIEEHQPSGATIMVMDPNTGEILGMATYPSFDPNRYSKYPLENLSRNNAVSDLYEPGSTFKTIVAAAGLQSGAFTTETTVDDEGAIERYGYMIRNWSHNESRKVTVEEMLYHSSNVGALQFAEMIGPETFYKYVKLFGYGQMTGIDLMGEGTGIIHWPEDNPETWSGLTLAQNSFGHGISVTPIQHLTAYAAIANGGMLPWPHVIKERCKDGQCTPVEPRMVRRVLDQATTDLLRPMLAKNAEHYAGFVWGPHTGSYEDQPLVPGYRVGAKTGTSEIASPKGGYEPDATIGSVTGWAPIDEPRVAVLVKVDRPQKAQYGIEAAIPAYQRIVSRLMSHFRIPPDQSYIAAGQMIGGPEEAEEEEATEASTEETEQEETTESLGEVPAAPSHATMPPTQMEEDSDQ